MSADNFFFAAALIERRPSLGVAWACFGADFPLHLPIPASLPRRYACVRLRSSGHVSHESMSALADIQVLHLRRPTCHLNFSLATRRRTIHSELPTIRELSERPKVPIQFHDNPKSTRLSNRLQSATVHPARIACPFLKARRGGIEYQRQRLTGMLAGDELALIQPCPWPCYRDLSLHLVLAGWWDTGRRRNYRLRTEDGGRNALTVAPATHHHPVLSELGRGHRREWRVGRIRLVEEFGVLLHGDAGRPTRRTGNDIGTQCTQCAEDFRYQ